MSNDDVLINIRFLKRNGEITLEEFFEWLVNRSGMCSRSPEALFIALEESGKEELEQILLDEIHITHTRYLKRKQS